MNGGTIALIFAGLVAFGSGAYIVATGERPMGVMFMGFGLMFQALALRQLRVANAKKDDSDAG